MNFQFTSKIKRNLFIIIAAGLAMFIIGFSTEKNHMYSELANTEDGTESLLVEYYNELPFTKEAFIDRVKTAASEQGITVDFVDMTLHHGTEVHGESTHHDEFEFKMLLTPHVKETKGSHGHDEGGTHGVEEDGHVEDSHGAHGGVAHSPMETLEHIVHEQGTFPDTGHARSWSNLLVNAFFFFGIGLGALFFIALQYATESGWGVVYKRILEAIIGWLPVGAIFLIFVFFAGSMHWNHIWHWMDPAVMDPGNAHFDPIIQAMEKVYESGTAKHLKVKGLTLAGKTGTGENYTRINGERKQLTDHSIFVGFSPVEKPEIAISVYVEHGYYGSRYAGYIATLMMEKYLKGSISNKAIENKILESSLEKEYAKPLSGKPFKINEYAW